MSQKACDLLFKTQELKLYQQQNGCPPQNLKTRNLEVTDLSEFIVRRPFKSRTNTRKQLNQVINVFYAVRDLLTLAFSQSHIFYYDQLTSRQSADMSLIRLKSNTRPVYICWLVINIDILLYVADDVSMHPANDNKTASKTKKKQIKLNQSQKFLHPKRHKVCNFNKVYL